MPDGRIRVTLGLAAMAALLFAMILVGGPGALLMAPALLALVPLLLGRYPGEALLGRLGRVPRVGRRVVAARLPRAPRSLGGRLGPLASRGASRAPPLPV